MRGLSGLWVAFVLACQRAPNVEPDPPSSTAAAADADATPKRSHAELLAAAAERARKTEVVARKNSRSAIALGRAAAEYAALARLSGDYGDHARAESLFDAAFATELSLPPYLLRARQHYSLHRMSAARDDLDRHLALPRSDAGVDTAALLLAADLALQSGRYDDAERGYASVLVARPSAAALASMAYYRWRTAAFDEAEALYQRSLPLLGGAAEPVAWTHLQLGLMDLERGRNDDARRHYLDAQAALPGYWLVDEHLAELLALEGHTAQARRMYLDVVDRTDNPEFMDALAGLARDEGDLAQSQLWIDRARTRYAQRMLDFPEATIGHAFEHHLEFGEPDEAVRLAELDLALRPNAETRIRLARAYLAAARPGDAVREVEAALASPVRTAELHAVAATAFAATGDADGAAQHGALARAINPTLVIDPTN